MTRLPAGVPARIAVTDLQGRTTTWLQTNLLGATYTPSLGQPLQITADMRSADPAVNTLYSDGYPLVAQSNRLGFVFLQETAPAWVCRAAGIAMSPQDQTDADTGTTHVTFYDAWQWLMGQPVFLDNIGSQIPQDGYIFPPTYGDVIALTCLSNTLQSVAALGYGGPPGLGGFSQLIDLPSAYPGVAPWSGTYYTGYNTGSYTHTPILAWTIQAGTTLGELFQQLTSAGNDTAGTAVAFDIIMEPVWDHENRPGCINQISIYPLAGSVIPTAPMAWGRFTRSATTADREHDGTPGSFINVAQYVAGQAGQLDTAMKFPNLPSINEYYSYWAQQFFPSQPFAPAVENLAVQAITLYKQGKRTFAWDPDPLRAALPGRDYNIGDRIAGYSSSGQRVGAGGYFRVQTIPVVINPDGVTSVSKLLVSPDWPQAPAALSGLDPTSAAPADLVVIDAAGFLPLTTLTVTVGYAPAEITSGGETDSTGAATVTFGVPILSPGVYPVSVSDGINIALSPTPLTVT